MTDHPVEIARVALIVGGFGPGLVAGFMPLPWPARAGLALLLGAALVLLRLAAAPVRPW